MKMAFVRDDGGRELDALAGQIEQLMREAGHDVLAEPGRDASLVINLTAPDSPRANYLRPHPSVFVASLIQSENGEQFASELMHKNIVPLREVGEMVDTLKRKQSEGFTRFQIKIGADPGDDIERVRALLAAGLPGDRFIADANRGYSLADARRAIDGLNAFDVYVEQPCATYAECLSIRRRCTRPFILDEVIDGPRDLARALADDALDALVVKLGHAGGITPARLLRDIALARGLEMRIEDTAGSEIARAAQAQLAAATPLTAQLGCYTFQNDHPPVADGAPEVIDGKLILNNRPGLGVTPRPETLGIPLAVYA